MTRLLLFFTLLGSWPLLQAQDDAWSLQRCVQYAWQHNLAVQQAEINVRNSSLDKSLNQWSRLPSLNASVSGGYQFGRTIDPTTNSFNNTRIGFNSYGLNGGVVLFDGNRINASIQQADANLEASRMDAEDTRQTIALNVATAFLNILLNEEQLANSQTQVEQSKQQLERTNRLVAAGQLPANARLDLEAQLARNEQTLIVAQNNLDIANLSLKQLLQLDPAQPLVLEMPAVAVSEDMLVRSYTLEEVYAAALRTQANVAAAQLRIQSSEQGEKVAAAGALPTLTLFGSLNTNYSTAAIDFANPNTDNVMLVPGDPVQVEVNGISTEVVFFNPVGVTYPKQSFGDQFTENFGQSLGVSLNIPIYNNHRNNIAKERARLGIINAELNHRQLTDRLKSDVQAAVTNFYTARNSYLAAQRSFEAAEAAWNDARRRFDLGAINTFEYNNAADNRDLAQRELTRARYQLLFNQKVVDFYMGLTM
ncbi:MAG: TolC family protein [Saprospiraceae bacterium]